MRNNALQHDYALGRSVSSLMDTLVPYLEQLGADYPTQRFEHPLYDPSRFTSFSPPIVEAETLFRGESV